MRKTACAVWVFIFCVATATGVVITNGVSVAGSTVVINYACKPFWGACVVMK